MVFFFVFVVGWLSTALSAALELVIMGSVRFRIGLSLGLIAGPWLIARVFDAIAPLPAIAYSFLILWVGRFGCICGISVGSSS
jgi:hypothetical protein